MNGQPMSHNIDAKAGDLKMSPAASFKPSAAEFAAGSAGAASRGGWLLWSTAFLLLAVGVGILQTALAIPPQIESDYCYQLLSVRRWNEGLGLTSLQPFAPGQPWHRRCDWGFLTQWPCGYPLLIIAVQWLGGLTLLGAASCLNAIACAATLTGWLKAALQAPAKRWLTLPLGLTAGMTGLVPGSLINPQSDLLLTAALPWIILAAAKHRFSTEKAVRWMSFHPGLFFVGLSAGFLLWLRYAALFVGLALSVCFVIYSCRHRRSLRPRFFDVLSFALGLFLPLSAILGLNVLFASGNGIQQQLNLGHTLSWSFGPAVIVESWKMLTHWGFYAHRPATLWLWSFGSLFLLTLVGGMAIFSSRMRRTIAQPVTALCGLMIAALLVVLVAATVLFGDKFNYVGLERYYLPVRPALVLFLLMPLAAWASDARLNPLQLGQALRREQGSLPDERISTGIRIERRAAQCAIALGLALALHWQLFFEWPTTLTRWSRTRSERAPSGAWAQAFSPGANRLYALLERSVPRDVLIFSNFHEYLAFETGRTAYPLPDDPTHLAETVALASAGKANPPPPVLFILDRSIRWRDDFWPQTSEVVRRFDLKMLHDGGENGWDIWAAGERYPGEPQTSVRADLPP